MGGSGRWRRLGIGLGICVGLLVLGVGAAAVWLARFDLNSEKPRIIALVKQATGRDLALNGKLGLKLSLQPTLQVTGVTLSNPPGFARPEMASLQRLDVQLRLLPLLQRRIEIERLVLVQPEIQLETNPQGQTNWVFQPTMPAAQGGQPSPAQPSNVQTSTGQPSTGQSSTSEASAGPAPPASSQALPADTLSVGHIQIENGAISYRDDASGKLTTLALAELTAAARSPADALHIEATASYNGTAFSIVADTGSLHRLQDSQSTTPWPLKLTLQSGAAKLGLDGTLTQPQQARGYAVKVDGSTPDLSMLAPLLPQVRLPPLHDVSFAAQLSDAGQTLPQVSAATIHVGASDLTAEYAGLMLDRLDVSAPAPDQPAKVAIAAHIGQTPLAMNATLGAAGSALALQQPLPVDVAVQAAGATLNAKGQIAQPEALSGVNLVLDGQIPNLAALSPLVRHPLPNLAQVTVAGTVTDASGGFRNGAALPSLKLTSSDGDIAGDATLRLGAVPAVTAHLQSARIDADTLLSAIKAAPPTAAPEPAPPGPAPASPAPPASTAPAPPTATAATPPAFADRPIPWALLRTADADLTWAIAALHAGGTDYRSVSLHATLQGGKLALDPVTAELATGHLKATATVDATKTPPPVVLAMSDPGLPVRPLLEALGKPATVSGNLEIYANLHGAGDTPRGMAASLDGTLGIAMAGGTIDNRLLGTTLSSILRDINMLDLVGRGGNSDVRCLASRTDFQSGTGTVRALTLNSSLLTMTGTGSVNLHSDTLDLLVRPQARLAGTNVIVPIRVTGPIAAPATRIDARGAAEDNAGTVAGVVIGNATPLGLLGGLLGADKLAGGGGGDICPAALAAARGEAAPPAEVAQPAKPKPSGAAGLLQQLIR